MYQLRSRGVELKEDLAGPSRKRKLSVETKVSGGSDQWEGRWRPGDQWEGRSGCGDKGGSD